MENKRDFLTIIAFAVFSLLLYLNSISAPFIFDDNHMIVNNLFIKNPKYFGMFFKGYVTSYPIPKGMCRPLLMLSFAFNYLVSKLNPVSYHIINILFHFLNAVLLFFILKALKGKNSYSLIFIVCLLFIAHPLNTEAVTYISSRSDLMVSFFILLGFYLYLKERFILSCICYVLGLLSKETGLVFGILIFGYYLIYQFKSLREVLRDKKRLFFLISLVISTLGYLYYRKLFFGGLESGNLRPFLSNILIQSWVSFFYLKLFLWPDNLNILHSVPELNSLLQIQGLLPFLGILLLATLVFVLRKRNFLISLGILWYLVGLAPKFYAKLGFPACEHHFYLPGMGMYMVLLGILEKFYLKKVRLAKIT